MARKLTIVPRAEDLSGQACSIVCELASSAISQRGRFTFALSGGSTVGEIYRLLAEQPGIDWSRISIFWGDERFVEHENPYSSFRLAENTLLKAAGPSGAKLFPVPVDAASPDESARLYETVLRNQLEPGPRGIPILDLAINGMGPDGHTASLFPGAPRPDVDRLCISAHAGRPPWVDRVTLTYSMLNSARTVLFAVTGSDKAEMVRRVFREPEDAVLVPASAIDPPQGVAHWLVDSGAASLL